MADRRFAFMIKANKVKGRCDGSLLGGEGKCTGRKKFEVYAPLVAEAVAAHGGRYLARVAHTK